MLAEVEDPKDRLARLRVLPAQQNNFLGVFDFVENVDRTYMSGNRLKCNITFRLDTDLTVTKLRVRVMGYVCYRFTKSSRGTEPDPQIFLSSQVFGFGREGDLPFALDVTTYRIPIEFILPHNIPASFNEDDLREVFYCVMVEADRPRHPLAFTYEFFNVVNKSVLQLAERISLDITKTQSCFLVPVAEMKVSIPRQAFLRGEEFEVGVEINNLRCGEARMNTIEFHLICTKEYKLKYDDMWLDEETFTRSCLYTYTLPAQYVADGETTRFRGHITIPTDCEPSYEGLEDDVYAVSYTVYVNTSIHFCIFRRRLAESLRVKICTEEELESLSSQEFPFKYYTTVPRPLPPAPVVINIDPAPELSPDEDEEPARNVQVAVEIHQEHHPINPIEEVDEEEQEEQEEEEDEV